MREGVGCREEGAAREGVVYAVPADVGQSSYLMGNPGIG